jgi:hypothetical protein
LVIVSSSGTWFLFLVAERECHWFNTLVLLPKRTI